jgi:ubiquinone/menaquinone biosynthesis C-methylase UbiE
MPTIGQNETQWSKYDWPQEGHEWSGPWGGSNYLWYGTILPRILGAVPNGHILEIAPGFGRCTQYLIGLCDRLTLVDITDKCIQACKERFHEHSKIEYFVNNGRSLHMVKDASIDFIFSWDSLVHADIEVFSFYTKEFARTLRPGGLGFIHHSNMASYHDPATGLVSKKSQHWRDLTMSADILRDLCQKAGLKIVTQEVFEWEKDVYSDCISMFVKDDDEHARNTSPPVYVNADFMREVSNLHRICDAFNPLHLSTDTLRRH